MMTTFGVSWIYDEFRATRLGDADEQLHIADLHARSIEHSSTSWRDLPNLGPLRAVRQPILLEGLSNERGWSIGG